MTRIYPFQRTARWLSLGFLAAALLLGGWATARAQEDKPEEKQEEKKKQPDPSRTFQNEDGELVEIQTLDPASQIKIRPNVPKEIKVEALSPHHEMLHKLVGNWKAQARMHLEPGAEPVESDGMVDSKLILDGRALETRFIGELKGRKFTGLGLDGYDTDKGNHFSFWMDTTQTGATYASGSCSHDEIDVVTLLSDFNDPETGESVQRKTILKVVSNSRYTYEEWHTRGEGEPTLALQIIFSKQEKPR